MRNISILLWLLVAFFKLSYAQTKTGNISGKVQSANDGVNGATINVLRIKDSSLVKMGISGKTGAFEINSIANGQYIVKVTAIGYTSFTSKPFTISSDNSNVNIQTIELIKTSK